MWPLHCGARRGLCVCSVSFAWSSSLPKPTVDPKCESVHTCPSHCRRPRLTCGSGSRAFTLTSPALDVTLHPPPSKSAAAQVNGGASGCVAAPVTAAVGRQCRWTRLGEVSTALRHLSNHSWAPDAIGLSVRHAGSDLRLFQPMSPRFGAPCGTDSSFPSPDGSVLTHLGREWDRCLWSGAGTTLLQLSSPSLLSIK